MARNRYPCSQNTKNEKLRVANCENFLLMSTFSIIYYDDREHTSSETVGKFPMNCVYELRIVFLDRDTRAYKIPLASM